VHSYAAQSWICALQKLQNCVGYVSVVAEMQRTDWGSFIGVRSRLKQKRSSIVAVQWRQVFGEVREAMQKLPASQLQELRPTWTLKPGTYHTLGTRTLVMGILNVTDDSFSDGGPYSLCVLVRAFVCCL
jgi:hypothetical protein